jgi:hypothetical protein
VAKWNSLALKLLMWFMGLLLVFGSGFGFIGASFFPFDQMIGVSASVAGIAFGTGIVIAGFDPEGNVSWVRALILYAIIEVIYQIVDQIALSRFDIIAFVIALLVAVLLLVLYPNKGELMMSGSTRMKARA